MGLRLGQVSGVMVADDAVLLLEHLAHLRRDVAGPDGQLQADVFEALSESVRIVDLQFCKTRL